DLQFTRIVADGEMKESVHTGRTGGLPHVGTACYRRRLVVPHAATGRNFRLELDGVMSQSTVYVNGHRVGGRPYGYSSFAIDITPFLHPPGQVNTIAVRVDNPPSSSRWYPGAGIYREVRLVGLENECLGFNGVWLRTEQLNLH